MRTVLPFLIKPSAVSKTSIAEEIRANSTSLVLNATSSFFCKYTTPPLSVPPITTATADESSPTVSASSLRVKRNGLAF